MAGSAGRARTSAGVLLFRHQADPADGGSDLRPEDLRLLIGHMGGPFWARKDAGAWSIPKGECGPDEDPLVAALREFEEELGSPPPPGPNLDLGEARQSAKTVRVFAREGDFDADTIVSNAVEVELPRGSGRMVAFPELDRARWVAPAQARRLLVKGQVVFVDRLLQLLDLRTDRE